MSGPVWSVSSTDILISGLVLWSSLLVLLVGWLNGGKKLIFIKKNIFSRRRIPYHLNIDSSTYSTRCGAGIEVTHNMRALQTPLHEVTVGSGYRLKTHTCPTYPSLLHTHTSLWFNAGAAHVNCSPALVFRMGTGPTKSAFGLRSVDKTTKPNNHQRTNEKIPVKIPTCAYCKIDAKIYRVFVLPH